MMRQWVYHPALDIGKPFTERLCHVPREPSLLIWALQTLAAVICRGWLLIYHRLTIAGRENLPRDGSFIMVANHASHLDTLCLLAALPLGRLSQAFTAAAEDHFFTGPLRATLCATVVNGFPFSRRGSPLRSLRLCTGLLETPRNIVILFPEGTRSTTGAIGPFKPGVGLLAMRIDVPVVPCHLRGTHRAFPPHRIWPMPHRIRLIIGEPLRFGHGSPQWIADKLCQRILTLSESEEESKP